MRSDLLFATLTGFLLSFAYPPFKLGILAYWALVPFFYVLENKSPGSAFRWGYLTGLIVTVGALNTLTLGYLSNLVFAFVLHPFYYALYATLHVIFRKKFGHRFLIFVPFIWVGMEFLRGLNDLGFSDLNLGYTHPQYLMFFEASSHWTSLLISFWICCLNLLIYSMLNNLRSRRKVAYLLATTIALLVIPLCCGYRRTDIPDMFDPMVDLSKRY